MDLFEQATRNKLRFSSSRGLITVEDLWDLPLTATSEKPNLDDVARNLYKQLNNGDEVSFVNEGSTANAVVQLKLDLVKYVIAKKKLEKQKALEARDKAQERQQLLEVLAEREHDELKSLSKEEIKARIAAATG